MKRNFDISAAALHLLGMLFMLLDHLWATQWPNQVWMTCIGRMAFPIFAFLAVEGFFHTKDYTRYILRMFLFAVISEIPFDLMYSGLLYYPYHQNVLWTLLIALLCMKLLERMKLSCKWYMIPGSLLVTLFGFILGMVAMPDFYGPGVLTVLTFYFFRGRKWWNYLGQFAVLYWLNTEIMGGLYYPIMVLGHQLEIVQQGLALFALVPIWLYKGNKGYSEKWFGMFCYVFYPVHCLLLALI